MAEKYLEAGVIINKRGLAGELKVDSFCDSLEIFCSVPKFYLSPDGEKEMKVVSAKQYKGFAYIKLEGVSTVEEADSMRGKVLYALRDDIDISEGDIFIADLLGLPVYDSDSKVCYGKIEDVVNYGASDVYVIRNEGKEYLFPAVSEFIESIDLEKGVYITPIPGIFDDEE